MKISIFLLLAIFLLTPACSNENNKQVKQVLVEDAFVTEPLFPNVEIVEKSDEVNFVNLTNSQNKRIQFSIDKNPGEQPIIFDKFFTKFCQKSALIIVLVQGVNTGVSHGKYYINMVIDTQSGLLIKTIEAGEISDKQTNEVISDDQKSAISALRSSSSKDQKCSK
jgi:hypothetical protein